MCFWVKKSAQIRNEQTPKIRSLAAEVFDGNDRSAAQSALSRVTEKSNCVLSLLTLGLPTPVDADDIVN